MSSAAQDATREIERLFRRWTALEVEGDLDAWLAMVADDAVLQPAGEPAVVGKPAIREYASDFFEMPIVKMEPGPLRVHVGTGGDLACLYGPIVMALEDESGTAREQDLKCMAVWKNEDGQWKLTANSWSANSSAQG